MASSSAGSVGGKCPVCDCPMGGSDPSQCVCCGFGSSDWNKLAEANFAIEDQIACVYILKGCNGILCSNLGAVAMVCALKKALCKSKTRFVKLHIGPGANLGKGKNKGKGKGKNKVVDRASKGTSKVVDRASKGKKRKKGKKGKNKVVDRASKGTSKVVDPASKGKKRKNKVADRASKKKGNNKVANRSSKSKC